MLIFYSYISEKKRKRNSSFIYYIYSWLYRVFFFLFSLFFVLIVKFSVKKEDINNDQHCRYLFMVLLFVFFFNKNRLLFFVFFQMLAAKAHELIKELDRSRDTVIPPYNTETIRLCQLEANELFRQNYKMFKQLYKPIQIIQHRP